MEHSPELAKTLRRTPLHAAADRLRDIPYEHAADIALGHVLSRALEAVDALKAEVMSQVLRHDPTQCEDLQHEIKLVFAQLEDDLKESVQPKIWRLREEAEVT